MGDSHAPLTSFARVFTAAAIATATALFSMLSPTSIKSSQVFSFRFFLSSPLPFPLCAHVCVCVCVNPVHPITTSTNCCRSPLRCVRYFKTNCFLSFLFSAPSALNPPLFFQPDAFTRERKSERAKKAKLIVYRLIHIPRKSNSLLLFLSLFCLKKKKNSACVYCYHGKNSHCCYSHFLSRAAASLLLSGTAAPSGFLLRWVLTGGRRSLALHSTSCSC
jgi:hypothetical protein